MHKFADRVVRRVLDAGGVLPLPAAFEDLAELDRLAAAIEKPEQPAFDLIESPVYVNGTAFFPPMLGCIAWARQVAEWFPEEPELSELALLYALHTARSKDYLRITDEREARRTVHDWAKRTDVSAAQAREVLRVLLPDPRAPDEAIALRALRMEHGDQAAKWPEAAARAAVRAWLALEIRAEQAASDEGLYKGIVHDCMREYGGTADQWIHETSIRRVLAAADESQRALEAESDAEAAAKGVGGASRWSVRAQKRFNVFAGAFERKYSAPAAPQPPRSS
jgi:hypothetical protein